MIKRNISLIEPESDLSIKTSMYWLVVRDLNSGDFKNAKIMDKSGKSLEQIKERFQKKHTQYLVIDGGEGLENRPEPLTDLPYIE